MRLAGLEPGLGDVDLGEALVFDLGEDEGGESGGGDVGAVEDREAVVEDEEEAGHAAFGAVDLHPADGSVGRQSVAEDLTVDDGELLDGRDGEETGFVTSSMKSKKRSRVRTSLK